jgi:hypothetical protein
MLYGANVEQIVSSIILTISRFKRISSFGIINKYLHFIAQAKHIDKTKATRSVASFGCLTDTTLLFGMYLLLLIGHSSDA